MNVRVHELARVRVIQRYVSGKLSCSTEKQKVTLCKEALKHAWHELFFTSECRRGDEFKFVDLVLFFKPRLFWRYRKRSPKPLLSSKSCHTEAIKFGIVCTLANIALQNLCAHVVHSSNHNILGPMRGAGYPPHLLQRVFKHVIEQGNKMEREKGKRKRMVIPFYNGVSHNVKALVRRFDVQVLFKNDLCLFPDDTVWKATEA